MKLTNQEELKEKNHICALDNWYTSLEVAFHLAFILIHMVGTIKSNRKGIPKNGIIPKTGAGKKDRGFMQTLRATYKDSEVFFNTWMDSKPVYTISTWRPERDMVSRATKDDNGKYVRAMIPRHTTTGVYNNNMGGTDLGDQRSEYVMTMLRSVKWPIRVFTHFLTVAGINSLAIYTMICLRRDPSYKKETTLDFFHELCLEILAAFPNPLRNRGACATDDLSGDKPSLEELSRRSKHAWKINYEDRLGGTHTPELIERSRDGGDIRRRCKACTSEQKIQTRCVECGTFLHFGGVKDSSCWWRFHHLKQGFCKESVP